jgi:hypothetical protein
MKTTIDLEQLSNETWPPLRRPARATATKPPIRLGVAFSVIAALTAIVLNGVLEVPAIAIVMAVVVVGFTLSWRAAGQPIDDDV